MCPRKGARFRQTQKEPNGHDTLWIPHRRRDHRQRAPEEHHGREKVSWPKIGDGQAGWYLANDVAHGKNSVDNIELVAAKSQLLLHARDIGISQVGPIEIVEEVGDAAEGENEEVNFAQQATFRREIFNTAHSYPSETVWQVDKGLESGSTPQIGVTDEHWVRKICVLT